MALEDTQDTIKAAVHILRSEALNYSDRSGIDLGTACAELVLHTMLQFTSDTRLTKNEKLEYLKTIKNLFNLQAKHGALKDL